MRKMIVVSTLCFLFCLGVGPMAAGNGETMTVPVVVSEAAVANVIDTLVKKYGTEIATRAHKGVQQAAALWHESDGSCAQFESFCLDNFVPDQQQLELLFKRISRNRESLRGHFNKITLDLKWATDIVDGDVLPIDERFAGYSVNAHLDDDFFENKIAFITLLNFPFYTLAEKMALGNHWSRKEWAYARVGDLYPSRIPSRLLMNYAAVQSAAERYVAGYNICMDHVLSARGEKLFPAGLTLLSHWNLRDELKAQYGNGPAGLEKQRIILRVMERIVAQELPTEVINNNHLDWNPFKNEVFKEGHPLVCQPETDTRYRHILAVFNAQKAMDVYCHPALNTYIKRNFDGEMEISQAAMEALFIKCLSAPEVKQVARLIQRRLKRKLQPFDIWYSGFKTGSSIPEETLDGITRKKYPDASALESDLPDILLKLGFSREKTDYLAQRITVDAARGSGHAWGPEMRGEKAHLRTRIPVSGMNYKGYNIALHEFGHNVEQILSLNDVDYYMMSGVPNSAFTEALAFVFQARDLQLLDMAERNPDKHYLDTLDYFWNMVEIMGVSLVDMAVWKWMYDNPQADAGQLKEAVIRIARDIWNRYYAGVFGVNDQTLLAVYSHMMHYPLYLSAYSYGHLVDFQISRYIEGKPFAAEVQRMYSAGKLIPQVWMTQAVGSDVSVDPVLTAVAEALKHIKK